MVLSEIKKKEDKGNETVTIDDINKDEADKTKEDDEAVTLKPKSR